MLERELELNCAFAPSIYRSCDLYRGTCDTLYDLAFLLMDLDHLGTGQAANIDVNAYLARDVLGAEGYGLHLLPLYLSVRAAIRAMVDIQSAGSAPDPAKPTSDARLYMRQSLGYLAPARRKLVAIGGYSGTGRTTGARAIAHHIGAAPGAILDRSDVVRKSLMDCDPLKKLGPDGCTPDVSDKTYAMTRAQARHALLPGYSAILDAVYGTSTERLAAENIATSEGVGFCGVWLDATTPTRAARAASRGPDASDADVHVVHSQAGEDHGAIHCNHINAEQPIGTVVAEATAILRTDRDQRAS